MEKPRKTAKGWKLFNVDGEGRLFCRPGRLRQYFEKDKWYSVDGEIVFRKNGFHFHEDIDDLNNYYDLAQLTLCEVSCKDVLSGDDESVCRSIKITKVLTEVEKFNLVNSGNGNSGIFNNGDYNVGDDNIGKYNVGDDNTGDYNVGNDNIGDHNIGNANIGSSNSGLCNTGNWNLGNWNSCNYTNGSLNTISPETARIFNKEISIVEYNRIEFPRFMFFRVIKSSDYKLAFTKSFLRSHPAEAKQLIELPNFDYAVFEEISGITREMIEDKLAQL